MSAAVPDNQTLLQRQYRRQLQSRRVAMMAAADAITSQAQGGHGSRAPMPPPGPHWMGRRERVETQGHQNGSPADNGFGRRFSHTCLDCCLRRLVLHAFPCRRTRVPKQISDDDARLCATPSVSREVEWPVARHALRNSSSATVRFNRFLKRWRGLGPTRAPRKLEARVAPCGCLLPLPFRGHSNRDLKAPA